MGGRGVRVPTWSRKTTQTSVSIHVYSMFSLGVIDFGVLPWGPHCGVECGYLGVCVWGVCARAWPCAQIVRELHTSGGGASEGRGVRVLGYVGPCWGLCGLLVEVYPSLLAQHVEALSSLWSMWWVPFLSVSIGGNPSKPDHPPMCASQLRGVHSGGYSGVPAARPNLGGIWASQSGVPAARPNLASQSGGVARPVWGIY